VLDSDGQTPVDIAGVSIQDPHRFGTMLGKGSLLGLDQVDNPATYARGPLKLVRTPLAWLQAGIEGCACILSLARETAPGCRPRSFAIVISLMVWATAE